MAMITRLNIIKSICKKIHISRKKPNSSKVTKQELMHINTYLSIHTTGKRK